MEGEVSLNLTFSVGPNEYYFYLPRSFSLTGKLFSVFAARSSSDANFLTYMKLKYNS